MKESLVEKMENKWKDLNAISDILEEKNMIFNILNQIGDILENSPECPANKEIRKILEEEASYDYS